MILQEGISDEGDQEYWRRLHFQPVGNGEYVNHGQGKTGRCWAIQDFSLPRISNIFHLHAGNVLSGVKPAASDFFVGDENGRKKHSSEVLEINMC